MTAEAPSPLQAAVQHDPQPGPLGFVAMAAAGVAYFVTMHVLISGGEWPLLSLALVFLPWIVALLSSLRATDNESVPERVPKRLRRIGALVALVVVGSTGWRFGSDLARHADLLLYLENLAFLLALSALFATSLRGPREALVTRLARVVRHGDMPPPVIRYTRIVTIVWAAGFATLAMVSSGLFFTQSRTVWSGFVNLAIGPLVAGGFVLEYAVRRRVLREIAHIPMMAGVHAFRRHAEIDRAGVASEQP